MATLNAYNNTADRVEMLGVPWIIPGWLAAGEVHMLAGASKTGKSQLAVTLCAQLTSGQPWYDGTKMPVSRCAMYSNEEDVRMVLKPRFAAAGGEPKNMHFSVTVLDAAKDLDNVAKALSDPQFGDRPPVRLILLDGVASAVDNINDNTEVRKYLYGVKEIAERTKAAIMLITHTAKGAEGRYTKPQDFVLGAQAWVAVPRMTWVAVRDKTEDNRCALLVRTGNLPAKMDGGVRLYGGDLVKIGTDKYGLPIMASKITDHTFMEGNPDDLFLAAIGNQTVKSDDDSEEDSLQSALLLTISTEGEKAGHGWVKHSDILKGQHGPERKVVAALNKLKKSKYIVSQQGVDGSHGATKWWGMRDAHIDLGLDEKSENNLPEGDWSNTA